MSDFIDSRNLDTRLEPAYPRQADSYAASDSFYRHRPSKHSRRTQASYASNGTWVPYPEYPAPPTPYRVPSPGPTSRDTQNDFASWDHNGQQQYSPPPDAVRAPSPAMTTRTRGRSEAGEPEFEYMDAEPDMMGEQGIEEVDEVGDAAGLPPDAQAKAGKGRFVGGFFAGLKKLPRAVLRSRRPPVIEYPGFSAPQFDPSSQMSYAQSIDVPIEHRAHTPALSKHSSHHSQRRPEDAIAHVNGDVSSTVVHQDPVPGPSGIVTNAPAPPLDLASPNLRPTSDYDKMPTPPHTPTAPSITSYLTRAHRLLKGLSGLPWVAPSTGRVAVDYFPGENPRSRYLYPRYREREQNKTWYTSKHKDVDLLSGERDIPLQSRRTTRTTRTTFDETVDTHHREHSHHQPHRSRTQRSGTASQSNPTRRPRRPPRSYTGHTRSYASGSYSFSRTTSPVPPMPGITSPSHSHLAFMDPHHHAQISYPYGYTFSPSPPQAMYLVPGPMSPTMRPAEGAQEGQQQQGHGSASPVQALQPAMPVYLVAGLPPQPMAVPTSPTQRMRSGSSTPRGVSPKSG
ncbi:hypothetical protein NEOLEDRAFT_1139778 [Neolentinus lepideus HHB14362 ss-1]|uniref:Uncharacterized protein n=1 Tax=Neolentinus lepideus HHB14362 ss-1 TaxID=1314782 RepID=A0A165PK44_9AGAM|nr:hypothetical protein NEOLEDRAFT_1139778 [Neolentinus lepideus HHB14362 ss-1]